MNGKNEKCELINILRDKGITGNEESDRCTKAGAEYLFIGSEPSNKTRIKYTIMIIY